MSFSARVTKTLCTHQLSSTPLKLSVWTEVQSFLSAGASSRLPAWKNWTHLGAPRLRFILSFSYIFNLSTFPSCDLQIWQALTVSIFESLDLPISVFFDLSIFQSFKLLMFPGPRVLASPGPGEPAPRGPGGPCRV